MTKSQKLLSFINFNQAAPPENIEKIIQAIDADQLINFLSWKMFGLKIAANGTITTSDFDKEEANKYIGKELAFVKELVRLKIKFSYTKIIPDEIPRIFFNVNLANESEQFADKVDQYFKSIYPKTETIRMENILRAPLLCSTYKKVFTISTKVKINSDKFDKEARFRKSKVLAQKAFGLFAAESAVIIKYFQNPVLLAGSRSVDTYKYEFFRYPKDRPILPKLFVI